MEDRVRKVSELIAAKLSASHPSDEFIEIHMADDDGEWVSIEHLMRDCEIAGGMVMKSAAGRRVLQSVARFSGYRTTVLIQGESGTGKELVARALHAKGRAPAGPFVTFNCSNLLDTLAESQLFGHMRGAFTDARADSLGYFRSANGGTLFLDEIGELPLALQPKLLRAVETHEIQPVGASRSHHVDIRVVAATNRDLRAMVRAGEFRDDLYYRLHAAAIAIPPLRGRIEDIEALAGHFLIHYNRLLGRHVRYISRLALDMLLAHEWPGNVRELAHAIENAVMLSDDDRIATHALPEYLFEAAPHDSEPAPRPSPAADEASAAARANAPWPLELDEVIKQTLVRSLRETAGNRRRAADLLGISRSTLYRMMSRYGLETESYRRQSLPPQTGRFRSTS